MTGTKPRLRQASALVEGGKLRFVYTRIMTRVIEILRKYALFIQVFNALVVLMIVYFLLAFFGMPEIDIPTLIGFVIFQPFLGFLISVITILLCLLIGLPLRKLNNLHEWLLKKNVLSILLAFLGFIFLVISFLPGISNFQIIDVNGMEVEKLMPNTYLLSTGWFLIAFGILHFYPHKFLSWLLKRLEISPLV